MPDPSNERRLFEQLDLLFPELARADATLAASIHGGDFTSSSVRVNLQTLMPGGSVSGPRLKAFDLDTLCPCQLANVDESLRSAFGGLAVDYGAIEIEFRRQRAHSVRFTVSIRRDRPAELEIYRRLCG